MARDRNDKQASTKPRRSVKRWLLGCGGLLVLALVLSVIAAIVVLVLIDSKPEAWAEAEQFLTQTPQRELQQKARGLENRMTEEVTSVRGGSGAPPTRTIEVGLDEANAWLDQRLRDWATSEQIDLPKALQRLILSTRDGQFVLSGRVQSSGVSQIVSMMAKLKVDSDGMLHVSLGRIKAGRMPVPLDLALHRSGLSESLPAEAQATLRKAFRDGLSIEPVWKIDARRVRLLAIEPRPDSVELTIRTER